MQSKSDTIINSCVAVNGNSFRRDHAAACGVLGDLYVWRSAAIPGGLPAWELSPTFKKNLKVALLGG